MQFSAYPFSVLPKKLEYCKLYLLQENTRGHTIPSNRHILIDVYGYKCRIIAIIYIEIEKKNLI